LKEGAFLLIPLVWGIFFAFALNPITNWFELKRIPRAIAIGISILSVTLLTIGIIYLLVNQIIGLLDEIPEIKNALKSATLELDQLIGSDSVDLENLSLFNFLSAENFNAIIFQTGKSLTLAGIIPLYTFLLI
jgi:predicted PurR-regulated permease PerM